MADNSRTPSGGSSGDHDNNVVRDTSVIIGSPASASSGDTLQEDGSSDIRSDRDGAASVSSPLSPDSFDLERMSLGVNRSRNQKAGVGRYTTPFQRGLKTFDTGRPAFPSNDSSRRDSGSAASDPFGSRAVGGSGGYRASRTWMSQDAHAMQQFLVIRNSMKRLFKNSDVAKWKISDYIAHFESTKAANAQVLTKKIKAREEALAQEVPPISQETQQSLNKWGLLGNFDQQGNFGRVLGEPTIWCRDWENGKDEIAPWPSLAEMKWEGDDRAKTGVGRFLPLPREEGPPGLAWNQLPCVEQYPIDQVARIPTMEDVYLPVDDQIEEEMEYLWSKDLEKAMDDDMDL
ncbi:hypothetical protein FB567DRAFT_298892 [Paraphoma chrysanthemicola]|uniref:Uncharacterized protein n=1 Tax=Paraphoma chrysanthemicola TaxID=798071 RepID=A0A8K0REA8_9PLEO|nr:hypothetical protein FB567DRAFT_298892 [Paraphoma chrysanthemicola]